MFGGRDDQDEQERGFHDVVRLFHDVVRLFRVVMVRGRVETHRSCSAWKHWLLSLPLKALPASGSLSFWHCLSGALSPTWVLCFQERLFSVHVPLMVFVQLECCCLHLLQLTLPEILLGGAPTLVPTLQSWFSVYSWS